MNYLKIAYEYGFRQALIDAGVDKMATGPAAASAGMASMSGVAGAAASGGVGSAPVSVGSIRPSTGGVFDRAGVQTTPSDAKFYSGPAKTYAKTVAPRQSS
jgi:hypothetical protein